VIEHARSKWFVIVWNTEFFMGWVVRGEQSIEYAVEFALANETDITDFDGKGLSGIWLPQGVAESRMRNRELIAKSVIMCHESSKPTINVEILTLHDKKFEGFTERCRTKLRGSEPSQLTINDDCSWHVPFQYPFCPFSVPV
jgi:hypothetical protein